MTECILFNVSSFDRLSCFKHSVLNVSYSDI